MIAEEQSAGPATVRALRRDERYAEAEAAARAGLEQASRESRRLFEAELARLAYYSGRFRTGVESAERLIGPTDLASARAALAASVNILALNNGHAALRHVRDALLRMRVLGVSVEDLVDTQVQQVHILAHMGAHHDAENEARSTLRAARAAMADQEIARAEYALGFALWFGGSSAAVDHLLVAERMTRPRAGTFWHWILFCLSACLRDLGYLEPAEAYATRSGVALRYERAWFLIRGGRSRSAVQWIRPPITRDEIPFARAVAAAIRLDVAGSRRGRALRLGRQAAGTFGRGGLDHWRWGSLWIAAADVTAPARERRVLIEGLTAEISRRSVRHWGFFEPRFAEQWSHVPTARHLFRELFDDIRRKAVSTEHMSALLPSLRLLNPEAIAVLTETGLTLAEIRTVAAAVDLWVEDASLRREQLAKRLALTEATVRSRMNSLRHKLGISGPRGAEPLLGWLAERDLLAPTTQRRVVQLLSKTVKS